MSESPSIPAQLANVQRALAHATTIAHFPAVAALHREAARLHIALAEKLESDFANDVYLREKANEPR